MAEPLKNQFGPDVVHGIAGDMARVDPRFDRVRFTSLALDGFEQLELKARAQHISDALRVTLADDPADAIETLIDSLPPLDLAQPLTGMAPFRYLPHVIFVHDHGLACFDVSMRAQHILTQHLTAEFSIRAFLTAEPERTLAVLRAWAGDPSEHVRRLVSEGTRPRLPWAPRLPAFQRDPSPVLALLELLSDDPSEYVRRSVANNLNDIAKDHPALVIETCRRWSDGATPERTTLIRHALRSLVKQGEPEAIALLGARPGADAAVSDALVDPRVVSIGGAVRISFDITNASSGRERFVVDYRVHFVKANGSTSAKTFKLATVDLEPGERRRLSCTRSLEQRTTRTHYAGMHVVDALVNGRPQPLGDFEVVPAG